MVGIRTLAESDLAFILEDEATGAGWTIGLTDPAGFNVPDLVGFSNDIAQVIDPDTGVAVSGRSASVSLRLATLTARGFTSLPTGIADSASKPWIVNFNDINGTAHAFKVIQGDPDRTLGIIVCLLELYK